MIAASDSRPELVYYQENRSMMNEFLPKEFNRVLEIGCGGGRFSENLRHRKCEIWGVEPFEKAATEAKKKLDHVLVGTFEQTMEKIPDDYFDLIICNDVIEHMADHDQFLESIKKKMASNSVLVGSIPNVRYITCLMKLFMLKDWPYADSGVLDRTHLRFFTEHSLRRTLQQHGYKIEKMHGINSIIRNGLGRSWLIDTGIKLFTMMVVVITLGYFKDTQYLQYAFKIKRQ